ncbi:MAG TPA: DUF92 domain-containing protein [Chitinophagaceae bacterium]|jgi:uncharacterized protein (TIGR00297 family)|nr:DUF92 domain-containing protein [Chitinophagaceae bacterium]
MDSDQLFVLAVIILMAYLAFRTAKLTRSGSIAGALLATVIFLGAGGIGLVLLGAFFVLGTCATAWKRSEKALLVQKSEGPRTAGQVAANGGMAAILGLLAFLIGVHAPVLLTMMAASLASATADTLSSELGILYGRRFYNILTLRKDRRGEDGVVSLEGTLIGVAGSMLIALLYSAYAGSEEFLLIVAAGTVGNLADSILGAALERQKKLTNNAVNFLNTLIAAAVAGLSFI